MDWKTLSLSLYIYIYIYIYREREREREIIGYNLVVWAYGISTFVGYLMPILFSYKWTVLLQTIQFSMCTQFNCQKQFYFKLLSLLKQFYFKQFSLVYAQILLTHG